MALARLQEEYFGDAATTEELEQLLSAQALRLETILSDFFGHYLYEVFCRVFFERLVQRVGEARANKFLKEIGNFIDATLADRTAGRDLTQIAWSGGEGRAITTEILETTLEVFSS